MLGGEQEWRDALKVGDKVVTHRSGYGSSGHEIHKVARLTSTQIILDDGRRYSKRNGRRTGDNGWRSSYLIPCTAQIEHEVFDRETRDRIKRVDWNVVPLTNILEILDKIPCS